MKSKFFEEGVNTSEEKVDKKEPVLSIKLPPPPPPPASSPTATQKSPTTFSLEKTSEDEAPKAIKDNDEHQVSPEYQTTQDIQDDDFGDFQAAN